MPYLPDNALDALLNYVQSNVESLRICSALPSNYTEATTTYLLGTKTSPSVATPTNRTPNGREIVVSAISDGSISADGTASHWALVKDSATAELLAAGDLASTQGVSNGNTFTLAQFAIGVPDAV